MQSSCASASSQHLVFLPETRVPSALQTLTLHPEHDVDVPPPPGKVALPAYSGVQGQQETSVLTESTSGVASPEGGASLRGTSSMPGINERGDTMV